MVTALERRFPKGRDPFKMVARLAEECGELAAEVQQWEDEGVKRERFGEPDPAKTAKEIMDVLTAVLAIARHYDLLDALELRLQASIDRAAAEGLITDEEVAASSRR
jgi:NTP pyrophosphatase (non-canonical NTP hydrolase)